MEEKKSIFRQKSLDKISSPEQLNDYIKVTGTGVWIMLAALGVLILGLLAWGIFGRIQSTIEVGGVVKDGWIKCYVKEEDRPEVNKGDKIHVEGKTYTISKVSTDGATVRCHTEPLATQLSGLTTGSITYLAKAPVDLEDGTYDVEIVTEDIHPISYLIN